MIARSLLISVLALAAIGCGEQEISVAESSELRVNFGQKLVQTSFLLNNQYRLPLTKRISFGRENETLARIFVNFDEAQNSNEIGAIFSAESIQKKDWPTQEIKKFPNWTRLPKTVVFKKLNLWDQSDENLSVLSLYQNDPQLIIGGAFLSTEFNNLPIGFLGTQYFLDDYGSINASVTVTGPTLTSKGGIYFLANFGVNPFLVGELRGEKKVTAKALPMEIIVQGIGMIDDLNPQDSLLRMTSQLERFL